MAFSGVVYVGYEHQVWGLGTHVDPVDGAVNSGAAAVEKYLTGYLVEKSLSIDNIFVMSTIFTALAVPALHQHRVLFWGVIGALAGIVEKSRYLEPALAVVLLIVGGKMRAAEWLKEMLGDHLNLALLLAVAAVIAGGVVAERAAARGIAGDRGTAGLGEGPTGRLALARTRP